jgi:hypothetical protein
MRGFPFFNFLLCLLLSGAVVLPLVLRATHIAPAAARQVSSQPAGTEATMPVLVTVKFVHAPQSLRLSEGDKVLAEWQNTNGELRWENSVTASKGARLEFSLAMQWPENTPDTVAEVAVEPDGLATKTQNVWSSGAAADEVLTFSWEGVQP